MFPLNSRHAFAALAFGLTVGLGAGAAAQSPDGPRAAASLSVVVVDQERLFDDSLYGQRILSQIDNRSETLATENRRIETALIAEERALTDLRPTLDPLIFRERAQAFDARVSALRSEQDAKLRAVGRLRDEARQVFYGQVGPVLQRILAERDALVLLDRRAVLSAIDSADITDIAIRRIDAEIGDGGDLPTAAEDP